MAGINSFRVNGQLAAPRLVNIVGLLTSGDLENSRGAEKGVSELDSPVTLC